MKTVLQTISQYSMLGCGDRVLCCVSGGADSVAMLHLLSNLSEELGISVCAVHVNHGLRGEESEQEEQYVREFCEKLGVKLEVSRLNLMRLDEETARKNRYQAFLSVADKLSCTKIATAHTEDDNAETVLLHLVRGSGLHGLTGIPAVRGQIIRPLLCASRESLLSYLDENGVSYCNDSSNDCVVFSRNRIRHRVFPELCEINPAAKQAIAKTASLLAKDEAYILSEVERCMSRAVEHNSSWRYPCKHLLLLHPSLASRVILSLSRNAMEDLSYSLESARIEDILHLASSNSPSAELCLPSNLVVRRVYEELEFSKRTEYPVEACMLREGESCRFGRFSVRWLRVNDFKIHKNFMYYELDSAIISDCITVRPRKIGDSIRRSGRPSKTLKRLMIEERIEKSIRDELPVLADGENLILVHGVGVDEQYVPKSEQKIIRIEIGLCCDEIKRSSNQ